MTFREFAENRIVILDGAMGTMLEKQGLGSRELPERCNVTHPEVITAIHKAYFDAGSNVVNTNTFGANSLKFDDCELCELIAAAVANARRAALESSRVGAKFVSLDIGPTGRLLRPFGDLDFEEAVSVFAKTVKIGVECGVDLITIETMNDISETRAALIAAKENSTLPIIVTNAYGADGKLLSGADAEVMAATLVSMGADYIGANCSLGPKSLLPIIEQLASYSSVPVVIKPNAGLPKIEEGRTVYDTTPEQFCEDILAAYKCGARFFGGCCGTTPEYIAAVANALKGMHPCRDLGSSGTVITSFCKAVSLDDGITLIGERINPTGKKLLREAILSSDIDALVRIGIEEEELGAHALDVNVGVPGINEAAMLKSTVFALQYAVELPLVIDSANPSAMESALRIYSGKALVNSVNGKEESMSAIFPLVKKYGGAVIALTLDENGIPATSEGRVAIAKRILARASEFGIDRKDIIFDPLAMAVSADKGSALVTLETVEKIKNELGCHTSLGVSNISFGLPMRDGINSAFFAMALSKGLSAVIMNPKSEEMMRTYYSSRALLGLDDNFSDYIARAAAEPQSGSPSAIAPANETLGSAIIKGLGKEALVHLASLLKSRAPLDIVNEEIIPALNTVGKRFEEGKIYLPSLLLSAETAKVAFDALKAELSVSTGEKSSKGVIVIATVKGDVHDIGKNIVKLLLENYGFEVIDLGKDVSAERIVAVAKERCADIVALSALMTTTVPEMKATIDMLRSSGSAAKVMVGGAVLTNEYAAEIGADGYAPDAMGAVRCAEQLMG